MFNVEVGTVSVKTSDGPHGVRFWADRLADRLVAISDTAPEPIRAQAHAFKNQVRELALECILNSIKSDRAYLAHKLSVNGAPDGAALINVERIR